MHGSKVVMVVVVSLELHVVVGTIFHSSRKRLTSLCYLSLRFVFHNLLIKVYSDSILSGFLSQTGDGFMNGTRSFC